ncbi:MAG: hypothetical protein WD335_00040 [Candidatus Paceibacterota bacterium]
MTKKDETKDTTEPELPSMTPEQNENLKRTDPSRCLSSYEDPRKVESHLPSK